MKQFFIFVILSIVLAGCETYPYSQSRYSVSHLATVKHIDTGKTYNKMGYKDAGYATLDAKKDCTRDNPNNTMGCLAYSVKNFYNDGTSLTVSYWSGSVAKYNSQFNNNRINQLELLIKDFENGKISKSEFDRKKKELIGN